MAPLVVALCADEAQDITGQCFFVWGGVVNMLRPWEAGEAFVAEERWDADELLAALRERFPEGSAPVGMLAAMEQAGGRSMRVEHMTTELSLADLEGATDLELEPSEWVTVEQRAIELFAEATGDHNWIHVDPERAAQGPFGTTVAHGYLSLSLLPMLAATVLRVPDARMGLNYGIEKIRFTAPVPSGSQVRLRATVRSAERRGEGVLYRLGVEIEIQGGDKPALVGEVVYLVF